MKKLTKFLSAFSVMIGIATPLLALENGDTVRILVPYSPGGGYDAQARLLAPKVQDQLNSGDFSGINVIVENMRGGGGAIATAHVYNADPDGTTILILDAESSLYQQTLADAPFKVEEFSYIAQHSSDSLAFQTRTDLGFESFDDALTRSQEESLLNAGSPNGGYGWVFPQLLIRFLSEAGIELKVDNLPVSGTSEVIASMRRGEVEMNIGSHTGFRKAFDDGVLDYLAVFNDPGEQVMCGDDTPCPDAREVLGLPEAEYDKLQPAARFRRIYVAPPGMDEELLGTLRAAFANVLEDPEFLEQSDTAGQGVKYLSGEDVLIEFGKEIDLANEFKDFLQSLL